MQDRQNGELEHCLVDTIDGDPCNLRKNTGALGELAESIRLHGIIQPLVGMRCGERVSLIAGHRRLAAAKIAGLTHVPVVLRDGGADTNKELQLIENVQREDLPALDVATALAEMVKNGQSAEVVATRVSKSAAWVRRHLALLKLDGKVVDAIKKNQLRFTQAEQVARVLKASSLDAALEAAKEMAAGKLSRRSSEQALSETTKETTVSHKRSFAWSGMHGRATLSVETNCELDAIRMRNLQSLVSAVERILAEAA